MKNIKYVPRFIIVLSFFILLICVMSLFLGRTKVFLRIDTLQHEFPNFYQHISNFSISYLLLSGIGFMWLLLGISFKYVTWLAISILISNFIYELWISILNTPDIFDAYFGLSGTILAFLFLIITKNYGLKANPLIETGIVIKH